MISDKAAAALKVLPYPHDTVSNAEYAVQLRAYDAKKAVILAEFSDSLASEYASTLPALVQDKIWNKSWNVAGRTYFDVEIAYISNAEFARFARETK